MKSIKSIAVTALVFFVFTGLSYADSSKKVAEKHKNVMVRSTAMSRAHGGAMRHGHYGWQDSLSPDQRAKLESMHLEIKRNMGPLKAELAFRKAELKNMVTSKKPDMLAIKRKIKEIGALRNNIMVKRYSHIVAMRKILSPDQRRSFDIEFISGVEHWRSHESD